MVVLMTIGMDNHFIVLLPGIIDFLLPVLHGPPDHTIAASARAYTLPM